jgi:hypothetical protein
VNASFVNKYFGTRLAVGRHIGIGTDPGTPTDIEIIGVLNDMHCDNLRGDVSPEVYLCTEQQPPATNANFRLLIIFARRTGFFASNSEGGE